MPKKLCGSVRWSRHRKDGVPKKLCGSVRWSSSEKEVPLIVSVSVSLSPSLIISLSLSSESDATESSVELVSEDSWLIWQAKGQGPKATMTCSSSNFK